jgi:hypothetical protein
MEERILMLLAKMTDEKEDAAYAFSDQLSKIDHPLVIEKMVDLLRDENPDNRYLAARTLSKMPNNSAALEPLLEAIHDKQNASNNGGLVEALEGFDISACFVDILRLYLFGNFKVSMLAKEMLDYTEFDITPRTIRKAEKHLNHFINNSKQDDQFEYKKSEVEEILKDLKTMFEGEPMGDEGD